MSNFAKTEKIIFGIALALLVAFSYFLYDDSLLFPKSNTQSLELIGNVSFSQNDVRRKNLDTFSWLPASRKDSVFQNDSIYTGERSEAVISLQDGSQIRIQPNSLINLNFKNGQMNLDLRYGQLTGELQAQSSILVTSGKEEFKLESKSNGEKSKVQFKKSHSGNVNLKLISGQVQYIDKKQSAVKALPQNSTVAVTQKGEVKQLEKPILQLLTENNKKWLRLSPQDPLPFQWDSKGSVTRYEFELSSSQDFHSVVASQTTANKNLAFTNEVPSGDYFWRLKAYDANGEVSAVSESRQVAIHQLTSPQIVSPVAESVLNYEVKEEPNKTLSQNLQVRWQAHPILTHFQWQIANDPEFQTVVHQGQTTHHDVTTPSLPSGHYWIRVTGRTQQNKTTEWSPAVNFQLDLVARKEERPDAPILVKKNIDFKVPTDERAPASLQSPQIEWKKVPKTKGYTLQIAKDANFASPEKYELNSNRVQWSQFKPGKYYYRVFAKGENDLVSPSSEVGTLEVNVDGIVLHPVKNIHAVGESPEPRNVDVQWSEVPFAKKYILQIDTNESFSNAKNMEFESSHGNIELPQPGKYHIRVQALDENQQSLTSFSKATDVLYSFRSPLMSPALMEPFNNASIFLQTEMEPFVWLEWKKVDNASTYRIEVSDRADFSRTLIAQSIQSNRFLIKEKIPLGKIYWRVRAESPTDSEFSEWTEKREFTLYHQKNETFVK